MHRTPSSAPDDAHRVLPVHRRHTLEPVGRGRDRQRAGDRALLRQQVDGSLSMRLRDLGGFVPLSGPPLLSRILVVGEAARQEVGLHPLHEILDAALLLGGAGISDLGVKAHPSREAPQGGFQRGWPAASTTRGAKISITGARWSWSSASQTRG